MADIGPDVLATAGTVTGKRKRFPAPQQMGLRVYDVDNKIFRDNSRFVNELVRCETNVLFTRPPQMGKTTLWSLAELLLSDTERAPDGLESYPPETIKNSWYVIRIDFGGISYGGNASINEWEERAKQVNKRICRQICGSVDNFLCEHQHEDIKTIFDSLLGDEKIHDLDAGCLVSYLSRAIARGGKRDDNTTPTLLFLVDEYDKPIRDIVFPLIGGDKIEDINSRMKTAFSEYVAFLDNVKSSNRNKVRVQAWLTGITPVDLTLMSSFRYEDCTFKRSMADAVGLLNSDVVKMMKEAIPKSKYFDEAQQAKVNETLKSHFNNLGFPYGSPLYHTGRTNRAMNELQNSTNRHEWLNGIISFQPGEEVPSSVFDVIKRARTCELRAVVSRLVDGQSLTENSLIRNMSLTSLLGNGDLGVDQYLTLLLHLGVVSVTMNEQKEVFKSTSKSYRKNHLEALNGALAKSITDLLELKTKKSMYASGESILLEFLHALSETRMASLISWAGSARGNRILELQLQGGLVGELHKEFEVLDKPVATTSEDKLACGRSDVTITTSDCKVVLELEKKDGNKGPTDKEWEGYHSQLGRYVGELQREEAENSGKRCIVGFVLVMYNGGQSYAVRKLADDDK